MSRGRCDIERDIYLRKLCGLVEKRKGKKRKLTRENNQVIHRKETRPCGGVVGGDSVSRDTNPMAGQLPTPTPKLEARARFLASILRRALQSRSRRSQTQNRPRKASLQLRQGLRYVQQAEGKSRFSSEFLGFLRKNKSIQGQISTGL